VVYKEKKSLKINEVVYVNNFGARIINLVQCLGNELDNQRILVQFLTLEKDFSFLQSIKPWLQTPASLPFNGYQGPFLRR
jgi:hypothetical protein